MRPRLALTTPAASKRHIRGRAPAFRRPISPQHPIDLSELILVDDASLPSFCAGGRPMAEHAKIALLISRAQTTTIISGSGERGLWDAPICRFTHTRQAGNENCQFAAAHKIQKTQKNKFLTDAKLILRGKIHRRPQLYYAIIGFEASISGSGPRLAISEAVVAEQYSAKSYRVDCISGSARFGVAAQR